MPRRARFLAATSAIAVLVACGASSSDTTSDDDIRKGEIDEEHPAVGLLLSEGNSLCTGTLVSRDVVLTAGHCVDEGKFPHTFYIGTGNAVTKYGKDGAPQGMRAYATTAGEPVPGYFVNKKCPKLALDVGLVRLAEPVLDVKPMPYSARVPGAG
ncbi:MAG: trypsin-like serine protease, partial [Myxococcales bacterium]|nr:trypsin-like serine protease [Myxococcales bacterium]